MKAVLGQERERERLEREKRRAEREEAMDVDGTAAVGAVVEDDMPSCRWSDHSSCQLELADRRGSDLSIEAPPSVLPQRRYCDITGLEVRELLQSPFIVPWWDFAQAPYTDPITGLRFHDKSIYELVKSLVSAHHFLSQWSITNST